MPKIKTHKASAKRFKKRRSGSLKRRSANADHFLGKRTTKRKRRIRQKKSVSKANTDNVKRALVMK